MKKTVKNIKIFVILLIAILLSIIAFFGIYKKENGIWNNLLPNYNYGMELKGVRTLKYTVDMSEEEKNVYIDSEGNVLGTVKEESSEENTQELPIEADTDGESINEEDSNIAEEELATPETNKIPYATENRIIKANPDDVLTIQNFEKTKKIIQNRLQSFDTFEYNIRLDNLTGELIIELPDNNDTNMLAEMIYTVRKIRNNR